MVAPMFRWLMRRACVLLCALSSLMPACSPGPDAPRQARIIDALVNADRHWMRTRAHLVEKKYEAMASDLYAFYRGSVPLWAADWADGSLWLKTTDFPAPSVQPMSLGDAHPENFGVLLGPNDTFGLEPNDLDAADAYPYLWDVRRLAVGLCVGAYRSNRDEPTRRDEAIAACGEIAAEAAVGYVSALEDAVLGNPVGRITDGLGSDILEDVFERAAERLVDKPELQLLQHYDLATQSYKLARGAFDVEDPGDVLLDLPDYALEELEGTLARYRKTLPNPPPPEDFTLLDAARLLGSGVASQPRIRVLILLRGPTDAGTDNIILELKELNDSGALGWLPPGTLVDDVDARIRLAQDLVWMARDAEPLWGTSEWLGIPVQLRREMDAMVTVRSHRWRSDRGSVADIKALAYVLGRVLGRGHARDAEAANGLAAVRANRSAFAAEQARLAVAYTAQVVSDWEWFKAALLERGPLLGIRPEVLEHTGLDDPTPTALDDIVGAYDTPPTAP